MLKFKSALPSLMHMRRGPTGLRACKVFYSATPHQHQNNISNPTPRISDPLTFNPYDYDWDTDNVPDPRSLLVYNHERRVEAFITRRCGSDHPKYDPAKFDITIYDLDHSLLEHEISEALGKPYLSDVEIPPYDSEVNGAQMFTGVFWDGTLSRPMVSLPVSCYKNPAEQPRRDKPSMGKWVHFLICPNSPYSFVSREAARAFIGDEERSLWTRVSGQNHTFDLCPSVSHFQGVNILGNNFLGYFPAEMRDLSDEKYRFEFLVGGKFEGQFKRKNIYHWEDTTAGHKLRALSGCTSGASESPQYDPVVIPTEVLPHHRIG